MISQAILFGDALLCVSGHPEKKFKSFQSWKTGNLWVLFVILGHITNGAAAAASIDDLIQMESLLDIVGNDDYSNNTAHIHSSLLSEIKCAPIIFVHSCCKIIITHAYTWVYRYTPNHCINYPLIGHYLLWNFKARVRAPCMYY